MLLLSKNIFKIPKKEFTKIPTLIYMSLSRNKADTSKIQTSKKNKENKENLSNAAFS